MGLEKKETVVTCIMYFILSDLFILSVYYYIV